MRAKNWIAFAIVACAIAGCGRGGGPFSGGDSTGRAEPQQRETIWDLFTARDNPNATL